MSTSARMCKELPVQIAKAEQEIVGSSSTIDAQAAEIHALKGSLAEANRRLEAACILEVALEEED